MSNAAAIEALSAAIARIRALALLPQEVAKAAAPQLKSIIDANIAAGRSPEGEAWKPRADGGKPLQNAAAAVTVEAHGTRIVASVRAPEAYHHMGRTRGNVIRAILPAKRLPAPFTAAIQRAVDTCVAAGAQR